MEAEGVTQVEEVRRRRGDGPALTTLESARVPPLSIPATGTIAGALQEVEVEEEVVEEVVEEEEVVVGALAARAPAAAPSRT